MMRRPKRSYDLWEGGGKLGVSALFGEGKEALGMAFGIRAGIRL